MTKAYHLNILREANFRDKDLVELSLGMLREWSHDLNFGEKKHMYRVIAGRLVKDKKLDRYAEHIYYPEKSLYEVAPIPFITFR